MAREFRPADAQVHLHKIDPKDTNGTVNDAKLAQRVQERMKELYDLHYLMFAENKRALLIVLQGIDASGKDGLVRHLASGLNPQGVRVWSFKQPSDVELDHDYLWRVHRAMPGRGEIAIFNRSHYEEVTVVKVHPELIARQNLPDELAHPKSLFKHRYRQINQFERMMSENGTVILKFFLHISKEEQEKRFEERLRDPRKHWKFAKGDLLERQYWEAYMDAFQDMIEHTNTDYAPWYILPADNKWYRDYAALSIVVSTLNKLNMTFPTLKSL
ncbi:MAG TPA: PPK2 family polyphosphate kinase [Candidatus Kapabacteria bacterium]|nr:PPK2 family polyphosphate kinase [Candidatus Kapabacteria bacterium]